MPRSDEISSFQKGPQNDDQSSTEHIRVLFGGKPNHPEVDVFYHTYIYTYVYTPLLRFRPLISHICDNEVNPIKTLPQVGFLVRIPPLSIVLNDPQMIIGDGLSKKCALPHSHKKRDLVYYNPQSQLFTGCYRGNSSRHQRNPPRSARREGPGGPLFRSALRSAVGQVPPGVHVDPGLIKPGGPGPYEHGEHAGSQFQILCHDFSGFLY